MVACWYTANLRYIRVETETRKGDSRRPAVCNGFGFSQSRRQFLAILGLNILQLSLLL